MDININELKVDKLENFSSLDLDTPTTYDIYDKQIAEREYKKFLEDEINGGEKDAD